MEGLGLRWRDQWGGGERGGMLRVGSGWVEEVKCTFVAGCFEIWDCFW